MSLFILSLSLYIPNAFGGLSFNIAAKGVILAFSPEHGYADWRNGEWRREFREGNGALEALLDNDKHDTHIFFLASILTLLALILSRFRTVLFEVALAWGWDLHDMI